jgi:hypothetical protein
VNLQFIHQFLRQGGVTWDLIARLLLNRLGNNDRPFTYPQRQIRTLLLLTIMTTVPFGFHPESQRALTLTTVKSKPHGLVEVSFTNVGATIVSWKIGAIGEKQELVLGFPDGPSYLKDPGDNPFFGISVGLRLMFRGNDRENRKPN